MLATGAYPQPRRDTLVKRELSRNLQTVSGLPFAAEELQTGDDTQMIEQGKQPAVLSVARVQAKRLHQPGLYAGP